MAIQRQRLGDKVYEALLEQVSGGQYIAGAHLNEAALCGELGVSRTPVREALFRLEAEGLVISHPNRGFFIPPLLKDAVLNRYPILAALEALALKTSPPFPEKQIIHLKLINRDLERASGGNPLLYQLDTDFHQNLINTCPNAELLSLIETLKARTRRFDGGARRGLADRVLAHREHLEIIASLETGTNAKAAVLLEKHWLGGIKTVTNWIAKEEKTHDSAANAKFATP